MFNRKKKEVITLKSKKDRGKSVVKTRHPQGVKISSDLYKALTILANNFADKFVKDNNISVKEDEVKVIYREKFKRFFKERDFLNLDSRTIELFNNDFKEDVIYKALMS